ncbi:MAG: YchF-related putative GTPase [Candidatus Micrarchaeia archaeon]
MLFALVGLPNKGKTTLFNALTHAAAQVADYPFTTIDPNKGVAFASAKCPCSEKGGACKPRNSKCANGTRFVPVNVIDVAGLVDGAHEGRGRGNQFLNDLSEADALVCVADASGSTDSEGNKCPLGSHDPCEDVLILEREIDHWLAGIAKRNASKAKGKTSDEFQKLLAGLKVDARVYSHAAEGLPASFWQWTKEEFLEFAHRIRLKTKPLVVAANKCDLPGAQAGVEKLRELGHPLFEVYADYELALQKARERGFVDYDGKSVSIKTEDSRMVSALEHIKSIVDARGTGVQALVDGVAFKVLDLIVAYPVQDEKKWMDNKDNLLPDALLLRRGATAHDLAAAIHTDLAAGFLYAVDGRTHLRIAREQPLKDGDVVKVVSTR